MPVPVVAEPVAGLFYVQKVYEAAKEAVGSEDVDSGQVRLQAALALPVPAAHEGQHCFI